MPSLLLLMSLISTWSPQTPDLKHFEWKNRLLLVFGSSPTDDRVQKQTNLIEPKLTGFEERDLLVFLVPETSPLHERFRIPAKTFMVLLLGKDGTEKLRHHALVEPETLFRLIDSMPMRRAESGTMKRQ